MIDAKRHRDQHCFEVALFHPHLLSNHGGIALGLIGIQDKTPLCQTKMETHLAVLGTLRYNRTKTNST